MNNAVVITGVSSGIGFATTALLVEHGFHVFGSLRTKEDAVRLTQTFGAAFKPLLFDVTDENAVRQAADFVRQILHGDLLAGLINNAGIEVPGPLMHISLKDWRHQLEVNLTGTFITTQAFAPLLGSDPHLHGKPGRIINISSVLGCFAYPLKGPYVTSKYGLEGYSDTLRQELKRYGISVITINPGPVATPFFDKVINSNLSKFDNTDYAAPLKKSKNLTRNRRIKALIPKRVSDVIMKALTAKHPRVRYVVSAHRLTEWVLPRLLPKQWLAYFLSKQMGLQ